MKKRLLTALIFLALPGVAWAQKTCSPVTAGVNQNCLVTITVQPGIADATHPQADSFKIRRGDAGGVKTVIGTAPIGTPTIQNSFTDIGNVAHCYDAISVKAGLQDSAPSPEQCWTTPTLAPVAVTTPQGLTLSAISSSTIRVTWDDTPDETGYELWGRTAKGNQRFALVASLPADSVTYDWTNRKRFTAYCAEVRGKIGNYTGSFTDTRCNTTSK